MTATITAPALTDACPRCVQVDGPSLTAAQVGPDLWRCERCGYTTTDRDNAWEWDYPLSAAQVYERLVNRCWRREVVDPGRLAVALGRYAAELSFTPAEVLAEAVHLGRWFGRTDGDLANAVLVALAAAGYQIIDVAP